MKKINDQTELKNKLITIKNKISIITETINKLKSQQEVENFFNFK